MKKKKPFRHRAEIIGIAIALAVMHIPSAEHGVPLALTPLPPS